ncbi:hypothetical protein [Mycolicibacterium pyrenivorans]|uniref:hypothetical protein n=1 Tax=Mycolicibacterium pyrenivorans TaxID=187102 RepID=UPI0021F32836|nr:hypothetical protein [Mycolicibacterium pyrenivorans]MCV7152839.1 hypothetical protein [Mycolicibacterium pyrenivorans]
MRFMGVAGLWTTGPAPEAVPLTAVLEVCGAVLSWTVDDPAARVQIAFTEPARAEWLWRLVGERGHSSIVEALEAGLPAGEREVAGVDFAADTLAPLRRLALGQWMRRWWPASRRDGIAELDSALLDGEIALLTAAAEDFFGDGTFDSDVAGLLRPHTQALSAFARLGDPRVVHIVQACAELAEDIGVAFAESTAVAAPGRRADYALAAGPGTAGRGGAIASGVGSVNWGAVPQGVFDAAEDTVGWRIEADGAGVGAVVHTELAGSGSPEGVEVRFRSGAITGEGRLDATGSATLSLFDEEDHPVPETAAWNHDWRGTEVTVGVEVDESAQVRDRVRALVRARLRRPGDDAFLAELLAAESDY